MMKDILKQKYLAGTSTAKEERLLQELLKEEKTLTSEEQNILLLLGITNAKIKARDAWMQEDESALFDKLVAEKASKQEIVAMVCSATLKHRKRRTRTLFWLGLTGIAAALCSIFVMPNFHRHDQENLAVTYFYGKKVENKDIALNMMQETMQDLFAESDLEDEMSEILRIE